MSNSFAADSMSTGSNPLARMKSSISGYAKTNKFSVTLAPPVGGDIQAATLACTSVSGLMYAFGTMDIRYANNIPLKLPNDEIYPDLVMSFNNVITGGGLPVLDLFESWMKLVKDSSGFGFYDDYVGGVTIQQYDEAGGVIKTYNITNYYPHAIVPEALSWGSENTIQAFQVLGTWF